jgi:hypothetical protein
MSDHPSVPLRAEPLDVLQARYPAAVADLIDVAAVVRGARTAPSKDPAHVFDTIEGLRLIVSREQMPDGRVGLHLSASFHADTFLADERAREALSAGQIVPLIVRAWQAIAQSQAAPTFIGLSGGGVLHFYVWPAH